MPNGAAGDQKQVDHLSSFREEIGTKRASPETMSGEGNNSRL